MPLRAAVLLLSFLALVSASVAASPGTGPRIGGLLTEYLTDPLGIDNPSPGLSWKMESARRGTAQTAYQVQVATSEALLASGKPDMWDSGKVASSLSVGIQYAGQKLVSRGAYHWRVRVWDENDTPTAFSKPARFEMALMNPSDWSATWIGVPNGGGNGYHSQFAENVDTIKWVQVDLGEVKSFSSIVLYPARPYNYTHDIPGFGFPIRYRIEAADEPKFTNPRVIADRTDADQPAVSTESVTIRVDNQSAHYVRLVATKLHHPKDTSPALALAELEVVDVQGQNVALGGSVEALDSIDSNGWSTMRLTDGGRVSCTPNSAAPMIRSEFTLAKPIKKARAYVTGLGYCDFWLNGKRVGDRVLDPPFTTFDKRVYYSAYDVTKMLTQGLNCAGALIGQGWYRREPAMLAQIEIAYKDGTTACVVTDKTWRWTSSPITENSLYNGETYDARLEQDDWNRPGLNDSSWKPVTKPKMPAAVLSVETIQPIKIAETLKPKSLNSPKPGVWVFDLGQNISGWCRLRVSGKAGTTVSLRHAELLYPDGTINQENLRSARATEAYTLNGRGTEVYEPRFTYHGFRYVQVEGFPGTPTLSSIDGRVVCTALEPRGTFSCSNELINKIQRASIWGERDNFHSIPTDCPQRDERQGWMADAHVCSRAMLYNLNMPPAYRKFLIDIQDSQSSEGFVPDTVPHFWGTNPGDPMWSAAYPILVWRTYLHTGDRSLLEKHYEGMKSYVESLRRESGDSCIISRGNYGDWIAIVGTPMDLVETSSYLLVTDLQISAAEALGKTDDANAYRELRGKIASAFNAKFLDTKTSQYGNASQCSNVLPLWLNVVPEEHKQAVFANLVKDIEARKGHLSTGFIGTEYLMSLLVREGRPDLAYTIATREDYPGWGYMIANGATTIWELWQLATGPGMNSHNHPALGVVSGWFYETLAGISPDEGRAGWERFTVKPYVLGDLTWAKGRVETVRGVAESSWKLTKAGIALNVIVPANSAATVYVPTLGKRQFEITEGGKAVWSGGKAMQRPGITGGEAAGDWVSFKVGSGRYSFVVTGK